MYFTFVNKMPKEVLIYGDIDEYSSAEFITSINEQLSLNANSEFTVRINTNGGSPEYTWGMISKFKEINAKSVQIDGKAYSMGLFFACYTDNVKALDVSNFILHRAAYPSWIENDENYFTDSMRSNLASINKSLRAAFEAKVDVQKFENLKSVKDKGITLDMVFSMDSRIDVSLTAKEAKQIGLVNEIISITPSIKAEIESKLKNKMIAVSAKYSSEAQLTENQKKIKNQNMTIEQLKAEHPALFAQVVALGVEQERDRVEACMAFIDVDAVGVKAAIESGKNLSQKQMADFAIKAFSKEALNNNVIESAATIITPAPEAPLTDSEIEAKKEKDAIAAAVKNVKIN